MIRHRLEIPLPGGGSVEFVDRSDSLSPLVEVTLPGGHRRSRSLSPNEAEDIAAFLRRAACLDDDEGVTP